MIRAIIFDLDGTLVQTEKLKAASYADAIVELSQGAVSEKDVMRAFRDVVGLSRQQVSQQLLDTFDLQTAAAEVMRELTLSEPWQAIAQLRLNRYETMISDPAVLLRHVCPYNMGLLRWAADNGFYTGLATMSHRTQAYRVLEIIGIRDTFDVIATADDIKNPKPDPEIYLLVARGLKVSPNECLVIEDSLSGIKAALAAGMNCIAVTSDFTRSSVHDSKILNRRWLVDDPRNLQKTAQAYIVQ